MMDTPHGTRALKLGSLVTLALMAATLAPAAHAQIRTRGPIVASPPASGTIRTRVPSPTPTASDCPDPIAARRAGRAVPAGCPGATEEQAPVRVDTAEASGERTDRGRRVGGTPVRSYRDPVVASPPNEGRIRTGRVPAEDRAADEPVTDSRRVRTMPRNDETEIRPTPVRDRGGRVTPGELPAENSGYEDRRQDSGGIRRIAPTSDDPRMRYAPDRSGGIGRVPDVEAPADNGARPHPWDRRGGDPVARTPGEVAPRRVPQSRYSDSGDTTPTPIRPVRPVTGGSVGPALADRGVAGQIECIFPQASGTEDNYIEVIRPMLCGFPGPGTSMKMLFQPEQWRVVGKAYSADRAVRVTYGAPQNGVYPVISVTEGRLARVEAACVPVYARYSGNATLTVGAKGAEVKPYRMWCTTDGKVVRPIDMFWTVSSDFDGLFQSVVEDGPIKVSYFDISTPYTLDVVSPVGLYPMAGSNWTDITATSDAKKVSSQTAGPSGYQFTYAEAPLTGRIQRCVMFGETPSGICQGYRRLSDGQVIWTNFSAFATPAIRGAAQRPAQSGETKSVYYSLMPGIIPPQYRGEAGGACRLIISVEVIIQLTPGKVGAGGGDRRTPQAGDTQSSGVAGTPYVAATPKVDTCQ